jgi:uncharacterized protein
MSDATAVPESKKLVEFLGRPASYAEGPAGVQVVETHISWVFLTDRHAYKLKKPVRFEFLDFSTPELRRDACHEEVRLNRRLAADVYLGVLPVTCDPNGAMSLAGNGQAIDWLVQMRRLPAEAALDVALRGRRLAPDTAREVANYLATFYAALAPKRIDAARYQQALERHVRANGEALGSAAAAEQSRIRRIQSAQLRFLDVRADMFGQRTAEGRIVDGHGDLRPEHIYLESPPVVIDCLEFSAELRTVDIADELSFLAMECERLGEPGLGTVVLATYQDATGDLIPPMLLAFYRAYRACVRAKVELLRASQQTHEDASSGTSFQQYIELAARYANRLGPPLLLVVGGLMGTGKSTLAREVAARWCIDSLATDRVRREMLGASASPAGYGEGHYRPDGRERVYDELFRQAGEAIVERRSVILDGSFSSSGLRQRAQELARRYGAAALYVQCTCPRITAIERIAARSREGGSESEARVELYDRQAQEFEPPGAGEAAVTIDTREAIPRQLDSICGELRRRLFD